MDLIFDEYPNRIYPFDFDTFFESEITCEIVTTNCQNGQAEYMQEHRDRERLMRLCRASSSMPLITPIVNIVRSTVSGRRSGGFGSDRTCS